MINEMRQMKGHSVFGGSASNGKPSLSVRMATANLSPVPQQAWIHSGSVRDNITFSAKKEEIDSARLNAVLDACALRADVQAMPDGDL